MHKENLGRWKMDIVSNAMSWSGEAKAILGIDPHINFSTLSDYLRLVHDADRERVNRFFEEIVRTGEYSSTEHRLVLDEDKAKHLHLQAELNVDEATNQIFLVGTVEDAAMPKTDLASEKKKWEESGQDQQAGRLTQLSYNIRTPLSSIVNLLYLLDKSNLSIQQRELIEDLKTSVDDLSIVLNDLLNYSLYISEELRLQEEVFDLEDLLANIARSGQFKSEQAGFAFELQQARLMPTHVTGDASKLEQLLLNLLELAIIHTVDGTKIEMVAEMVRPAVLRIAINYLGTLPVGEIPDRQPELKSMLLVNSGEEQSTAQLSAFIALKLSKLLDGRLISEIRSENQCRLGIELSIQAGDPEGRSTHHYLPKKQLGILLVEDHFLNQIATKRVLTSWSEMVQVITADSGEEALEVFGRESIDLVLMDLKLPGISGIEAARLIRQTSDVPIIALTASSSKQEEERCFTVGMNAYLHKPIKPEELYLRITQLMS